MPDVSATHLRDIADLLDRLDCPIEAGRMREIADEHQRMAEMLDEIFRDARERHEEIRP